MSARLRSCALLLLIPLLCAFDPFRSSNASTDEGNARLGAGKVKEALERYQRAAKELPDDPGVHYNLGIAQFQLGQLEQARTSLSKATAAHSQDLKARAFYNLGSVLLEQKKYKEAASAFTRSLQISPAHRSSKWNLELALRRAQEEEKKKKKEQQEKDKKDKDKQKDEKKDNKDKQDQNKQDNEDKQNQDQKKQQEQQKGQQKDQRPEPKQNKEQSRERQDRDKQQPKPQASPEMENVLDALDRNDKNLQRQRARRLMGGGLPRPTKDW